MLIKKTIIDIYYTIFYPHLIYRIEFWSDATETNLKIIETVQNKALRIIARKRSRENTQLEYLQCEIMKF